MSKELRASKNDRAAHNKGITHPKAENRTLKTPFNRIASVLIATLFALILLGALGWLAGFFSAPGVLVKVPHGGHVFYAANPAWAHRHPGVSSLPPVWIPARKPEGVRRVVVLGDSTATGFPMGDYHLGRLIGARWRARFPGEAVEVINLSAHGADSAALRGFAREAMMLEPDMIVLRAGNDAPGTADDFRDIVKRALARQAKVLFVLPASGDSAAMQREIASSSGPSVSAVDPAALLRARDAGDGADFFLDGIHPSFAGRVLEGELTVDGMAALWGLASRGDAPEAVEAWWQKFPTAELEARRDAFFTAYDEHDMWSLALKQLPPAAPQQPAALAAKVRDLKRRAAAWDTTDIIVAYERAQLQNPRDPLIHFAAGRLLGMRGEGTRAEEAFARGFALQPLNITARLNFAAMQIARGDTDAARASLQIIEKFDPQADGLLKMQSALALREAELPAAAALLQKHLAACPDDAESWLTLSEIQLKLGDHEAAESSRRRGGHF